MTREEAHALIEVIEFEVKDGFNTNKRVADALHALLRLKDPGENYSTDEIATGGTWIDGKPIYRKTWVGEKTSDGKGGYELVSSLTIYFSSVNIDKVIVDNIWVGFPKIDGIKRNRPVLNAFINGLTDADTAGFQYSTTGLDIFARPSNHLEYIEVTLDYTKTTD